jgi:hypothetical protein
MIRKLDRRLAKLDPAAQIFIVICILCALIVLFVAFPSLR